MRDSGRVVRKALMLAFGVRSPATREVIAPDVGEAEAEAFWCGARGRACRSGSCSSAPVCPEREFGKT